MNRNLDGVYFRVERNGKWETVCFSDLTDEEMKTVLDGKSDKWLRSMCVHLGTVIKEIAEEFGIVRE